MRNPIKFGDYYLFERVAVGGMAEVFKGVSYGVEGFERLFAVKRVLPSIAEDNEFIEMFIDEAKIAVQLTHANIGQVFELGNAEGAYFIAMEFVQGKDLRAIFDRSRKHGASLHVAMCCHVIKEVCEALEYAHNKRNDQQQPINLIHRDVSPQNILVSYDGGVKLIDFGIAKAAGKASKTQAGILKGKFGYMSPEQVRGRTIDKRSDLFSLAVVFYELLTLERCFQGESDFSTLEKVRTVDIRRPASLNRNIPPELERILLKGLAKTPEQRYQSAAEFQDALQKYLYQSGNFYSRKDLTRYMKETFGRELDDEQRRMTAFRQYARQHIREARRDASVDIEVSKAAPEPFTPDLPALSWEQDEIETSIWDRSPSALTAAPDLNSDAPAAKPGLVAAITDRPLGAPAEGPRSTSLLPSVDPSNLAAQQTPQRGQYPATAQLSAVQPADLRMPVGAHRPRTGQRLFVLLGLVGLLLALGIGAWWMTRDTRAMHPLKIDAYPSTVELFVDGVSRGEQATPTTIQLDPGPHIIGAVAQGYVEARQEIQLAGPLKMEFRLVPVAGGTGLTVETEPAGATVYIDGQALAESTPVETRSIEPGLRKLRIEKDGYLRWDGTVTAAEGKMRRVETIRLKPASVSVTFRVTPEDAELTVILPDGTRKVLAAGDRGYEGLPNSGGVIIEASAKGHAPLQRPLPQYDRRTVIEELTLTKEAVAATPKRAPATTRPRPPVRKQPAGCQGEDCPPKTTRVVKVVPVAKPVRRPKPVQPKPAGRGSLKLLAKPPAVAFIDGKKYGWTPLIDVSLPAGSRTIELVREGLPQPYRKTIRVYIERDKSLKRIVKP